MQIGIIIGTSFALTIGLLLPSAAPAFAAETTTTRPTPQTAARPELTPDQLKKLPAVPFYQPGSPPVAGVNPKADSGPRGSAEGAAPDSGADTAARREFPRAWKEMNSGPGMSPIPINREGINFGSTDVFTEYCANCNTAEQTISPHRAIGLLTNDQGSCSASVVSGQNIVVTAAHCCYTRGQGWRSNFRFYPAYRFGQYPPYGSFGWTSARILTSWITRGARQDDVCLISLGNNSAGRPVTFYTGWLGREWNWPTNRDLHSLGYPANIGGTNTLQLCTAESFGASSSCGGNTVLNMGCSMTNGASGGPWIDGYRGGNWVDSVVSGYDSQSCTGTFGLTFNGPRFTTNNIVTLCNAQGC